jgi:hypothetical protein
MDTTELLRAVCREASEAAARIDGRTREKLLKRARKQGMTNEGEVIELVEAWRRAAKKMKHLHHGRHQHKGH